MRSSKYYDKMVMEKAEERVVNTWGSDKTTDEIKRELQKMKSHLDKKEVSQNILIVYSTGFA